MAYPRIAEILIKAKLVDELQARSALSKQAQWGGRLATHVVEMGFADEPEVADALAKACGLQRVELAAMPKDPAALAKIDLATAESKAVFPYALRDNGKTLWMAMADPCDLETQDFIAARTGCRVRLSVAGEGEIKVAIARHYKNVELAEERRRGPPRQQPTLVLEQMDVTDLQGNGIDVPASRQAPQMMPAFVPPPPAWEAAAPAVAPQPAVAPAPWRAPTPAAVPQPAAAPAPWRAPIPAAAPQSAIARDPFGTPIPAVPQREMARDLFGTPVPAAPQREMARDLFGTPVPAAPQPAGAQTPWSFPSPTPPAQVIAGPNGLRAELPPEILDSVSPAVAEYLRGLHSDLEKTSRVLRGLIELCVEKQLFGNDEIRAVLARGRK